MCRRPSPARFFGVILSVRWAMLASCLAGLLYHAHGQVVLRDGAWLRIDNGAWVVLTDPLPGGLAVQGTGGRLRTEGELNRVRWNIGSNTGVYVLPYVNTLGDPIPFTCQVTTPGVGGPDASLTFSTYNGSNWDNATYMPQGVTHMNNWTTGGPLTPGATNQSAHVVDRFWMVDAGTVASTAPYAYGTPPDVSLGFTYHTTNDILAGNVITASSALGAQRFNATVGLWGDLSPGIGTWASGSVTGAVVPPGYFDRVWTLSELANPLPVELIRFDGSCEGSSVILAWTTGIEQNSDRFLIQQSPDGVSFTTIGALPAAGNSSTPLYYRFAVPSTGAGGDYFRLVEEAMDGALSPSPVVHASCTTRPASGILGAWQVDGHLNLLAHASTDGEYSLRLLNVSGQELRRWPTVPLLEGDLALRYPIDGLASGIYLILLEGGGGVATRRVFLH